MATARAKPLVIRLVCKSMPEVPSTEGELDIGIQDKAQNVHRGRVAKDGSVYFNCTVEAKLDTPALDFRGSFVHGAPQGRFIYLSWKRRSGAAAPWFWRVKVPLAGITRTAVMALKPGEAVLADISGRRPHSTEPISWICLGSDPMIGRDATCSHRPSGPARLSGRPG
jgi:Family of unknown function (DUF5990)